MNVRSIVLISVLLLAGCGVGERPLVKVTLLFDGYSAEEMDELLTSELAVILQATSTQEYTAISIPGQIDVYAIGERGMPSRRFLDQINRAISMRRNRLPRGSKIDAAETLTKEPPVPEGLPEQIDEYQVEFDRERLADCGLTARRVSELLEPYYEKPATQQGAGEMLNLQLTTPDGKTIPLSEVATAKIVQKPGFVIRKWPEKP